MHHTVYEMKCCSTTS